MDRSMTVRRVGRRLGSERGAQLVEFAFSLPILLVVFAGMVDFGLIFQHYEVVINAAREGARRGIETGATQAIVEARVKEYVTAALGASASSKAKATFAGGSLTPGLGPAYPVAVVTVTYTDSYFVLGPIISLVGGKSANYGSITLTAVSTMRTKAPGP